MKYLNTKCSPTAHKVLGIHKALSGIQHADLTSFLVIRWLTLRLPMLMGGAIQLDDDEKKLMVKVSDGFMRDEEHAIAKNALTDDFALMEEWELAVYEETLRFLPWRLRNLLSVETAAELTKMSDHIHSLRKERSGGTS